jgi:hypothetical protein
LTPSPCHIGVNNKVIDNFHRSREPLRVVERNTKPTIANPTAQIMEYNPVKDHQIVNVN